MERSEMIGAGMGPRTMRVPGLRAIWLRTRSLTALVVLLVAWELITRDQLVRPLLVPALSTVVQVARKALGDGTLAVDLATSLFRAFVGLGLGLVVGVVLGIAMARGRFIHWLFDPVVALGFPAPKIAFIPIFILWFGIGSYSKILLVAFACVFPIVIGAYDAARSVNRAVIWSALSLGTSQTRLLFKIMLPSCLPRVFGAFRVAVPVALITTFTAEMVAGGGGMGDTLIYSQRFFETPVVFVYIIVMLLTGIVMDRVLIVVRDRFFAWDDAI